MRHVFGHGNESPDSTKDEEFLDELGDYKVLKKGCISQI
jgi:hypothetical protein